MVKDETSEILRAIEMKDCTENSWCLKAYIWILNPNDFTILEKKIESEPGRLLLAILGSCEP